MASEIVYRHLLFVERALESLESVYVRFVNPTPSDVVLLWLNYNGLPTMFKEIEKCHYVDVNTYKTHPWFCIDKYTGQVLLVNGTHIYFPENKPGPIKRRVIARVRWPLLSLKRITAYNILNLYPDGIDTLDIPFSLKELLRAIKAYDFEKCGFIPNWK